MDAKQKKLLENKIYQMLKEGMLEDFMPEVSSSASKTEYEKSTDNEDDRENARASDERERNIIKWLTDDQENNAAVAAQLWPETDEDTRRSLFSKKLRGHDSDGKEYHFSDEEINELWKIKNMFVKKIDESKKLTRTALVNMIKESLTKKLNENEYAKVGVWDALEDLKQYMSADDILNRLIARIPPMQALNFIQDIKSIEVGDDY